MKVKDILLCCAYLALTLAGMSFIKLSGQDKNAGITICGMTIGLKFLIGVLFYGLSFLLFTFVISKMQVSLAIPILAAVNSCAMVLIGMVVFGEKLNVGQLIGIGIVVIGVFVLGCNTMK